MTNRADPRIAELVAEGYVVLRAKSYEDARRRQWQAEGQAHWAQRDRDSAVAWARDCLAEERRLRDRCTHLYGLAAHLGATHEQLLGATA